MVPIFLSWVVSPVMCAIITILLFGGLRMFVLRSPNSFQRAFFVSGEGDGGGERGGRKRRGFRDGVGFDRFA